MSKAATPQAPTVPRLNREAALLGGLYKAYLSDREFLRETPGGRILAFLDSHEVKAYIDPDAPGSLTGFIMQLENAFGGDRRRTTVGLRHDQILNGLLFDPSRVCGILPSHAEEMDREVAFRFHRWFDTMLDLVQQAQDEIRRNRKKAEQIALVARNEKPEDQRELRVLLVRFFQTHAPALTAILSDSLFTPHKRLQAILDNSRVTLFEDVRWTDFGVKPHVVPRLQRLKPELAQTQGMQKKLRAFEYRKNTIEANVIDATALAHMALLREELDRGEAGHVRVVLVSRARTLLRAAADMAERDGTELLVRHPRMLALAGPDAAELDKATELALGTALDVWQSQLRNHRPEPDEEEETELAPLKEPARAFLATWDTFESSRLAVEVKWRHGVQTNTTPSDEGELAERLLTLFCDANAEAILNRTLIERFNKFSSASSRFLLEAGQLALRARLTKVPASGRVYITPVVTGAVGPIQVADWEGSPASGADLSLEEIASKVRNESERPLVWSLALACAGRWKQAAIFARSALQLADLEGNRDTADEARLLRAEVRRLGALAPPPADADNEQANPEERYERSMQDLAKVRPANADRRLREEAAQLLEAALAGVEIPDLPEKLRDCFTRLDKAADEADGHESKARYIALLLMLYLYDFRRCGDKSALRAVERARASTRHQDLAQVLKRVQEHGQTDAMPHRARAMEVIGHVLFEVAPADHAPRAAASGPRPANVPPELRGELPDLLGGLEVNSDKIAGFLKDEIETILEALRPFHNPELLLSPVPTPQRAVDQLRQRHPDIANRISLPLDCLEAVGKALLSAGPSPAHGRTIEQAIGDLEAAIALGYQQKIDAKQMFYLRSAFLYARLLDATLEPKYARPQRFQELIREYDALRDDYRDATLPYVRLGYLAEKIGQIEVERVAIAEALELVDTDRYYPQEDGGPHWLQSFVRRRHALIALRDNPAVTLKWVGTPGSAEASEQARALIAACRILLEAERRDIASAGGEAHDLERQRRTNNIVYYGSRLIERTGSERTFNRLSPDQPLAVFVDRLLPRDIEGLEDIDMVHTVGCYYAAVANIAKAQRTAIANIARAQQAARRIFGLMSMGKNMAGPETAEAHDWLTAGQQAELAPVPA